MKKNIFKLYGLTDLKTGNMVIFNIEDAVVEVNNGEHARLNVKDMEFVVSSQEFLTLLQGCGIEVAHCTPKQEEPASEPVTETAPETETAVEEEKDAE